MITCVIPVKGTSERLQGKNFRLFNGIPLYEHKFKQLEKVPFDKIVVSSESEEVMVRAESYGFNVHFRDPKYSTSEIPMKEVFKYICSEVEGDDIAWCNVTNPLVEGDIYECALDDWGKNRDEYDCLLSVHPLLKYIWHKGKPLNWDPYNHPKSQDLDGCYAESFFISIARRKDIIKHGTFEFKNPYFFMLGELISTKIDHAWQFDLCEALWREEH